MDKKLTIIGEGNSVFNRFMRELRDEKIHHDRHRFRMNLERCSEIMAYEISKHLDYKTETVTTPLGELEMSVPASEPVIVSILRAGLPMHNGFLRVFDQSENGFISAYRKHTTENEFIVKVEYAAIHPLEGRTLIMVDPMLATGQSIFLAYKGIVPGYGHPEKVFLASIVASEAGIEYVKREMPHAHIFVGAVDRELTAKSYIVPGLGDAGDLAYGTKE